MKYDGKMFYRIIDKFSNRIIDYISEELTDKYKEVKTIPKYSKRYFLVSGQIEGLSRVKTKIALERQKNETL